MEWKYFVKRITDVTMSWSEKLGWAVYAAPWYNSSHQHRLFAKVILVRASKPSIVKCYGSKSFDLTNATFIVILKSIVSFYFGLVQMKTQ